MKRSNRDRVFDRVFRPDPNDKKFRMPRGRRRRRDRGARYWRPGPLLDQGFTSGCVGYSIAGIAGAAPVRNTILGDGVYWLALRVDEFEGEDDEGTSIRAGLKVIEKLGLIDKYLWAWDLDSVVSYLLNDGPVLLATYWFEGMNEINTKGFVEPTGELVGGHAYYLRGVNVRQRRVTMRQSWGPWGINDSGDAYISFDALDELLTNEGEAVGIKELKV